MKDFSLVCEQIVGCTQLSFAAASASALPSVPAFAVGCYLQPLSGTVQFRITQNDTAATATTGLGFVSDSSGTPVLVKLMSYTTGLPLSNVSVYSAGAQTLNIVYFKL